MRQTSILLVLCCATTSAAAQLTTTYTGIQRDGDKDIPASAVFSIENGRVAMIMRGSHTARMLFDQKAQVLRIVTDENKSYFDLDKASQKGGDAMGMMASMQKQLEAMSPAQRAMAEQMMKGAMSSMAQRPPLEYVWTKDKQTVAGYECTRVEGMRGTDKVTEYCGSTSNDFRMSDAERQTMLDMQGYLRNFMIMVKSSDDATRAFQWDTKVDGYPVVTRCFNDGKMTLELTLQSVDRKPLSDTLFAVPRGYKKMDLMKGPGL
ncbi:MAG TPA: DUF4412 domain-containing protein [Gemmatimonadaceae bacterium]|nr:DUF4412 domain-containing protein [Gemmatimonadaceae bacterium]